MKSWIISILAIAAVATSCLAAAQPPHAGSPGKDNGPPGGGHESARKAGKEDHHDDDRLEDAASLVLAGIAAAEARQLARSHGAYRGKPLPPGIRKNLARGKPLPPGIAAQTIPPDMRARLPHNEGYEWRRYGTDLVLVSLASAVAADVLVDVFD